MDKSFKRWTTGAAIAAIVFAVSIWWAGNDNGISRTCSATVAQGTYCDGFRTNLWWLILAIGSVTYLGIYIAGVRRLLQKSKRPDQGSARGPHSRLPHARGDDDHWSRRAGLRRLGVATPAGATKLLRKVPLNLGPVGNSVGGHQKFQVDSHLGTDHEPKPKRELGAVQ